MAKDKLLRPDSVALRLGVTTQHVRRLCRLGKLDGVKLSERNLRIRQSSLEEYRERLNDY